MLIVKADDRSEAGVLPREKELADMGQFNVISAPRAIRSWRPRNEAERAILRVRAMKLSE